MAATAVVNPNVKFDNRPTQSCHTENEDGLVREVESAVKDSAANEISTMIEKLLNDKLRKSLSTPIVASDQMCITSLSR